MKPLKKVSQRNALLDGSMYSWEEKLKMLDNFEAFYFDEENHCISTDRGTWIQEAYPLRINIYDKKDIKVVVEPILNNYAVVAEDYNGKQYYIIL